MWRQEPNSAWYPAAETTPSWGTVPLCNVEQRKSKKMLEIKSISFSFKKLTAFVFCILLLECSATFFQKHGWFPQNLFGINLLISFGYWPLAGFQRTAQRPSKRSQPGTEEHSHLVTALQNICPFYSPCTVCIHKTSATAQKLDPKSGKKSEAAFRHSSGGGLLSLVRVSGQLMRMGMGRQDKVPASLWEWGPPLWESRRKVGVELWAAGWDRTHSPHQHFWHHPQKSLISNNTNVVLRKKQEAAAQKWLAVHWDNSSASAGKHNLFSPTGFSQEPSIIHQISTWGIKT